MEKSTAKFAQEIEVIKRIVNGYLATDPILSDFILDSLSIKPKDEQDLESEANANVENEINTNFLKGAKSSSFLKRTRCCVRSSNGKRYLWHGPGFCPNGDSECGD